MVLSPTETEELFSNYQECLGYFKTTDESNERVIDRIGRNASYVLSFFGSVIPTVLVLNPELRESFLNDKFSRVYLFLYFLVIVGAIGSLMPKLIYRNIHMSFGFKPKTQDESEDVYLLRLRESKLRNIVDFTNQFMVQKQASLNEIAVIDEAFAKLSYISLGALFFYIIVNLSGGFSTGLFLIFSQPELWIVSVMFPIIYCLIWFTKEWTKLKITKTNPK
jgi:hypothetical protein